jgi:hypothetical protein
MMHGYRVVTLCCVGLLVAAALVTALTVRTRLPEAATTREAQP